MYYKSNPVIVVACLCAWCAIVFQLVWITAYWQQSVRSMHTFASIANASNSYIVYDANAFQRHWKVVLQYPTCVLEDFYSERNTAQQAFWRATTTNETLYHTTSCWGTIVNPDCMTADQWDTCRSNKNGLISMAMTFLGLIIFSVESCIVVAVLLPLCATLDDDPRDMKPPSAPMDTEFTVLDPSHVIMSNV